MKIAPIDSPLPMFYLGPDLKEGPLPAVFYFALSAQESLLTDPFNSPVTIWNDSRMRIFSVDLPYHGEGYSSVEAMQQWADAYQRKEPFLESFLLDLFKSVQLLFPFLIPGHIGAAGLSRGGFIASHLASFFSEINALLGFAPLTSLFFIKEFSTLKEPADSLVHKTDLSLIRQKLASKIIRVYMGNRDMRVSSDLCFQWIRSLVEAAFEEKIRSPSIEMFLKPSIGYLGHGTTPETFHEGATWLAHQILT